MRDGVSVFRWFGVSVVRWLSEHGVESKKQTGTGEKHESGFLGGTRDLQIVVRTAAADI